MNARVPYLARLAGRGAGGAALRPPRQLFADDAYTPARPAGSTRPPQRPAGDHEERALPLTTGFPGLADEPAAGLPGINRQSAGRPGGAPGPSLPATSSSSSSGTVAAGTVATRTAAGHTGEGIQAAPAGLYRTEPERIQVSAPTAGVPPEAGPGPAGSASPARVAGAGPAEHPATLPASGDPRPPGDAAPGQLPLPTSWADPPWDRPVEPPRTTGDGGTHARPAGPAAQRDLLPPPAQDPWSRGRPGRDPAGGPHPWDFAAKRARVSIGTIEVTVLPPVPAPPSQPIRPAVQPARGRTRPPSLLAASTGADRLRDGLRRWHGTAQG
jgi:hypothetical protein